MGNLSLLFKFSWYYFREEDIPYTKNKQAKLLLTFIGTKEGDKGEGEALKRVMEGAKVKDFGYLILV